MLKSQWKRFHKGGIPMKKSIIAGGISAFLLGTTLVVGVIAGTANSKKIEKAAAEEETITKYLPMNGTNFHRDSGLADRSIEDMTSGRRDTFHDGRRSYNAMDNFLNTMDRGGGEDKTGEIRSIRWVHRGGYVSFLIGGNSACFVNIFDETSSADRFTNIHNDFYSSRGDAWDDAYRNGEAGGTAFELSANMALKYYHLSDEWIGHEFIVYIKDDATSYYGGITFGDLRVNQTLEEVKRTFEAHKQQISLDAGLSTQNGWSADYMLNTYYKGSYYDELNNAAALDNADEGFETYGLTNWAYDRANSTADINFAGIVSNNDAKDWAERMPANKSDNYYVNADASGIGEGEKYTLVSNEFTLSGNGFISAKLGGGTAVMSLIDSTGAELATTRIAAAENTNILNPAFVDNGGTGNIMDSGSRFNTMARVYLDASAHLGKTVRIVLSDARTGGNWGLAYFDEVVTKYNSVPTLKVDKIQQQFNDTPLYHGVVTDKYVGSASTDFGKAYAFVQTYYSVMRNVANGQSWCTVKQSQDVQDLITAYGALDASVKALVDAAQDYDFGSAATSANWYLTEANLDHTIGQTMYAVQNGGAPVSSRMISFQNSTMVGVEIALISSVVIIALALYCFFRIKRRKLHK